MKHSLIWILLLSLSPFGCSQGGRVEETGTIEGTVTLEGAPLPTGAFVVLEDKTKGITMTFNVSEGGKFSVGEAAKLPAGTYAVAILPPDESGTTSEADYDQLMNQSDGASTEPDEASLEIPAEFRSPQDSGQSITVTAGAQIVEVQF